VHRRLLPRAPSLQGETQVPASLAARVPARRLQPQRRGGGGGAPPLRNHRCAGPFFHGTTALRAAVRATGRFTLYVAHQGLSAPAFSPPRLWSIARQIYYSGAPKCGFSISRISDIRLLFRAKCGMHYTLRNRLA